MSEGAISQEFTDEEKTRLAELETKHIRITAFRVKGHGLVVIRKPKRAEYRAYNSEIAKPQVDSQIALENYAKKMTVVPTDSAYDEMMEDYPGLIEVFEIALKNLAVGEKDEIRALGKDWKTPAATT